VLDTGAIRVVIDADGLIRSIVDRATGREVIAAGERGGLLTVFQDTPNQWDAWDIDRSYRRKPTELTAAASVSATTDAVVVVREFGQSTVASRYSAVIGADEVLIETEVDWHEQQKLLKLGFPLDIKADAVASEIQFGHVNRPTHQNTSWDFARFETVAHRWLHVGEPGFGVAIANDSTYGHDVTRQARADGGITTLVRESLLRAPLYPDPHADQGVHTLQTAIRVAPSVLEAADSGYRMNLPIREVEAPVGAGCSPLVSIEAEGVFVESVKLAEDRSGDVVIRFYEARGARMSGVGVALGFDAQAVWRTDLLERELDPRAIGAPDRVRWDTGEPIEMTVYPFEIVTLRSRPVRRLGSHAASEAP
jgi:alpha-mannosidase